MSASAWKQEIGIKPPTAIDLHTGHIDSFSMLMAALVITKFCHKFVLAYMYLL